MEETPIIPICTNLRYDGTNEILYFNIGELRKQNLSGEITVYSDENIIYHLKFDKLFDLPLAYSVAYKRKGKEEVIVAKLNIKDKVAQVKLVLNNETTRKPMSWNEWENKGK